MKKFFFILSMFLLSAIPACAVDWQIVETNIPNFNLYIDVDSIKQLKDQQYVYAIKYNYSEKIPKVAYLKSDLRSNYIGIIQAEDFDAVSYHPTAVFATPHVFMKPINDNSFLTFTHNYLSDIYGTSSAQKTDLSVKKAEAVPVPQKEIKKEKAETPVSYKTAKYTQSQVSVNMEDYVTAVSAELQKNWNPPASGRKTQAIVIISAGNDGGLYRYHFAKSSGDEATDRSILSAIKQTVPFPKFAKTNQNLKNFQFVFDYGIFKKSVK